MVRGQAEGTGMPLNIAEIPVFILCGGLGTRLKEMTGFRPKPLPAVVRPISVRRRGLRARTRAVVKLAREGQLAVFQHRHFWACMDTQRDHE